MNQRAHDTGPDSTPPTPVWRGGGTRCYKPLGQIVAYVDTSQVAHTAKTRPTPNPTQKQQFPCSRIICTGKQKP